MQNFNILSNYPARRATHHAEFQSYLERSSYDPFVLDLKNQGLMDVINSAIKAKSKRSPNYAKQLSCLINNLKEMEAVYNTKIRTIQVTDVFWDYFVSFCEERGLKSTTILTMSNQLRSVLNWAIKHNAQVSPTFRDFKIRVEAPQEIALTADEVSRIKYFDIDRFYGKRRPEFRKTMHSVRDMFFLSVCLYQRYSDMSRISKSCFERNIFRITQQKTGALAVVNIDKYSCDPRGAYEVLERYNWEPPYKSDITNYNKYLHILMRDIGLTEPVRIETRKRGNLVVEDIPKWKLITSHTARRTAITIGVTKGHNVHALRKCSGHVDLRCFDKYVVENE